jgi:hypothetical protein
MVMVTPQPRPIRGYGSSRAADENVTVHRERALKKPVALLLELAALGVLGLAALGVAGAETAAAQGLYYYGPGFYGQRYYVPGLAPWRVARIVRSAGLTPLSAPARRGPIYEVVAIDPEGRHMRVAVDAYRGAIMSVRPVAALRPNGEPYGSRVVVAPPPEEADMAPSPRLGPPPSQAGVVRLPPQEIPPQGMPPHAGPSQAIPPESLRQQPMQPPPAARPGPNPRIANAPAITGATTPVESQRTPIPRPRPSAAATAAVTPAPSQGHAPVAAPSTAATAPAEVPEAPPAPIRARPSAPAAAAASAAAASASAKAATPAGAANASAATGNTATAKTEPRPPTTLVPVAPLE